MASPHPFPVQFREQHEHHDEHRPAEKRHLFGFWHRRRGHTEPR